MSKGINSKKFRTPAMKGDKYPLSKYENEDKNGEIGLPGEPKGKLSHSLSDSQYEDLFNSVLGRTLLDTDSRRANAPHPADGSYEEDKVAVPEPNVALSPAESAEDGLSESTGASVKTPDRVIDNSVLPPIIRKKPASKLARLKMKIRPTKLNFDDPTLVGEPGLLPKPKKSNSLPCETSHKPKTSSKPSALNDLKKACNPDLKKKNCPRTPDMIGSQKKDFRATTERREPESQSSFGSLCHGAIPQTPDSSLLLCSQSSSLQMPLSPRSRLFRLQRKRNVGLWVQCTNRNCTKWRYLPTIRDPTEVPDNWQCFMNNDMKYASCSAPEKGPTPVEEEDLIHNVYTAGSMVWAHLAGYPWWPAMVDDDPDVEQYYWITETCDIPTHYNVTFFDEKPVTRAWLTPSAITKYSQPAAAKDVSKVSAHGTDYSRRIEGAKRQAEEALKLSIDERLKKFSFVARYKGSIGKKRYPSDSEDEVVEKSVKRVRKVQRKNKVPTEEEPMVDIPKSLEIVKEVNEVLNELMSECESENEEELRKDPSRPKVSGMLTAKKERQHAKTMENREAGRKGMKKKELKGASDDVSVGSKCSGKAKCDVIDSTEGKEKRKLKEGKRSKENKKLNGDECKEIMRGKKSDEGEVGGEVVQASNKMKLIGDETEEGGAGEGAKAHAKPLSNKRLGDDKAASCVENKNASSNNMAKKGKAKEQVIDKNAQSVQHDSETRKQDNLPKQHRKSAELVEHSVRDNESVATESNGESDVSSAQDSSSDVDEEGDCETEAGSVEGGEGSITSEERVPSSSGDEAENDESQCLPVEAASCGRASADLFEVQPCNSGPVLGISQQSADFEIEE